MRILRARDYRRMKWKNGGGETAEIAVVPEDAALDAFGWRVSMATVASDGPFSTFAGIDRTLTVLEGDGIVLEVEGRDAATLTPASGPFRFPGDTATSGRLVGGSITDLNVMTRRGQYAHVVTPHQIDGTQRLESDAPVAMLFCAASGLRVTGAGLDERLGRYDAAIRTNSPAPIHIEGQGAVFLIELTRPTG